MDEKKINQVSETCLLGVIISENLKWHSNTASLVRRCYQRMIILRNLSSFHVPIPELVNIYCLYIRSVAEQSSVVWSSSITSGEEYDLERIQKVALRIILGEKYVDYKNALNITNLQTLQARREMLSQRFAVKCTKNIRTKDMFPLAVNNVNTRNSERYQVTKARTNRLYVSAIPSMQRKLNQIRI